MIHFLSDRSKLKLPDTIYLIGSGPSVSEFHSKIPEDAYRVYLNGAINIDSAKPDLWFAHCQNILSEDWWKPTYKKHQKISFFGNFITERGYISKHCFDFNKDCNVSGVLTGTTVAGIAMQLLPLIGAKEIILVGIDLEHKHRYDGSNNPKNSQEKWDDIVGRMNYFIERRTDCTYRSLGPSRMNIGVVDVH